MLTSSGALPMSTNPSWSRVLLITGGAGFIGSHVVRLFVNKYPDYKIINLDKLTYAGNLANLKDIEDRPNYRFVKMDICDFEGVLNLLQEGCVDIGILLRFPYPRKIKEGKVTKRQAKQV